ncbi:MAG TPA: formyltetrahydrofolate deformylase [bacterium]|jgi:formyltetrahydrofolate deformylase|nr:formyltetrahydrofolate deformylase [bacterium]
MQQGFLIQVECPDRPGLVAAVAAALAGAGANILDLAQHSATERGLFLLWARVEAPGGAVALEQGLAPLALSFGMRLRVYQAGRRPRVAILASRTAHCLYELMLKHADGHLACDFVGVASNHPDLELVARHFGVPFVHLPHRGDQAAHEAQVQAQLLAWDAELVVLARYMRVLSPDFTGQWSERLLNIHHGFLPAFSGARPYHQAWDKGVKMVGATAHFATAELDAGPIIAQDVLRVSDRASVEDLVERGKDIERRVLVEALRLVLERRVFVSEGRTFVLE